jgi:hypothetical protein
MLEVISRKNMIEIYELLFLYFLNSLSILHYFSNNNNDLFIEEHRQPDQTFIPLIYFLFLCVVSPNNVHFLTMNR